MFISGKNYASVFRVEKIGEVASGDFKKVSLGVLLPPGATRTRRPLPGLKPLTSLAFRAHMSKSARCYREL